MDLGRLLLRGVVGPLFVGHGTQKLFGWFDGHGLDAHRRLLREPRAAARQAARDRGRLGRDARRRAAHARRADAARAGDAHLGTMVTAIRKVHAQKGPWVTENGYEYNLTLIAAHGRADRDRPRPPVGRRGAVRRRAEGQGLGRSRRSPPASPAPTWSPRSSSSPRRAGAAEGHADVPGDPALEQQPRFEREARATPARPRRETAPRGVRAPVPADSWWSRRPGARLGETASTMRRRSPAAKKPDAGLEICPVCGRDFVQPVSWEPAGEAAGGCSCAAASAACRARSPSATPTPTASSARCTPAPRVLAAQARQLEEERLSAEIDAFAARARAAT